MNKENLTVALHKDENTESNLVDGYANGLMKGFHKLGIKCFYLNDCSKQNLTPNLTIGFDSTGLAEWQNLLNRNITNIMWSTDSLFYKNYEIVQQFDSYKTFVLFHPAFADTNPIKTYLPNLVQGYIPPAVDDDLFLKNKVKKEFDITFLGSIIDYEQQIQNLKTSMPELVYKLMTDICEVALEHPYLSMWEIYQLFKKQMGIEFFDEQYLLVFRGIADIITSKQRVKMIESLKGLNITVYGDGPWEKYISKDIKVKPEPNPQQSKDIISRSKIFLHSQPFQLAGCMHQKVLDAVALDTFVLTGHNQILKSEFADSIEFGNPVSYEDFAQKAEYYISNSDEREQKAKIASEIVKQKHKWSNRAQSILDIID